MLSNNVLSVAFNSTLNNTIIETMVDSWINKNNYTNINPLNDAIQNILQRYTIEHDEYEKIILQTKITQAQNSTHQRVVLIIKLYDFFL